MSTDKDIHIELTFHDELNSLYTFEKNFKMITTISTSNMYLFNEKEKLVHYKNVNEIINAFIEVRMNYYDIRKKNQVKKMEDYLRTLSNKYKYILELLNDTIDLRKKKSTEINTMLKDKGYDKQENNYNYLIKMPMDSVNEENVKTLKNEYEKTYTAGDVKATQIVDMYYTELKELEKML